MSPERKVGTTGKGIGPSYSTKAAVRGQSQSEHGKLGTDSTKEKWNSIV